ncbi:MAG: AAA family ATPase [Planctomycetes bacterium]|nr:AAA family ATPase [Planctomycetota bacterium]
MTIVPSQSLSDDVVDANGDRRVIGGRYQVLRQLKSGHDTEALLAFDPSADTNVVIKTAAASSFSASARMRLEHEAHVLSQVKNGQFAPVLDYGSEDDQVYLVMPFIPGITLQARLQQGPLSVMDAITLGHALLTALSEVHAHDVLHRDVKPTNVIVNEGIPLREATLIDFGLARSTRLDASIRDQWVGTAQYLSPEGAGLLDQEVTARSDLYSAGIVLFECLAGWPPFAGDNVGEVLRQHMTVQPPELRGLGLQVPRVLDEVIQRLLRKDPRDRYQSAAAVVADLTVIAEALERGESEPALVVGLHDRRQTLTEPAFVGRDQELSTLNAQLERTRAGQGGLVLLEAESGGGKSRLLAEFAQRGVQQGAWVLRGQGLDQAAQRPFQLLTGVAEGLVTTASLEPDLEESIRSGLGDHQEAACSALPQLAKLFGSVATSQLGPETFGEARNVQALIALLDALGSTGRPVLVLLDDCQWADQLTVRVLSNWHRRQEIAERAVLVVAAFRSEEVPSDHPLRALTSAAHLKLPTFQSSDVRKLVESMAGPLPDEAVSVIERLAEGSPFMAAAAVRGLVESGALVAEDKGWRVDPLAMEDASSSRHAAAFLSRRIELLPEMAVKLLSVGAVLGKEFDLFTASKLARQSSAQAITALHEAQQRHIVWAKVKDDRCAFIHDKLRETLLDRMPENERRELHLRAAVNLEAGSRDRVYDLAYHFDAAGESQRALSYAMAAAEDARIHHAFELAEQQYRIAQRGVPDADEATRYRIAEGLGDVLMLRARYEPGAEMFEAASRLATDDFMRAEIQGKLAELAFKQGDNKTSSEKLEQSLRSLRRRIPSGAAGFLLFLVWELLVQTLHTMLPKLCMARRTMQDSDKEFLAIRLYTRLSYAYFFERGKVSCLWAHLRAVNLAERYPPTRELGHAWATHAPIMSVVPWLRRGEVYAKKSLEIRKELSDVCGQGQSLHYVGVVYFAGARYDDCISVCREAVRLLERTGDFWERNVAWCSIANSLYRKGDLAHAVAESQQLYEACVEIGDDKASGFALDVWSRASGGRVPAEVTQAEMQKERNDVWATAQVLLAEAVRLVGQGELAEAVKVLTQAHEEGRKLGMNAWVSPILPWLATTYRLQWQKSTDLVPHRRRQLLKNASRAARQALRVARKFKTDLPHALREAGLIAAMQGSTRRARKHLDESLAVADRQDARFEHSQTLLARGRLGTELGWPGAEEDVATARQALRSMGADFALDEAQVAEPEPAETATLSLFDRFDTVLDAGRRIASQLSRKDIFREVRDAAHRLLRGERCLLLKLEEDDADEDLTMVSGEIEAEYSRDMADRALATGQVIVFTEGQSEEEGALLSGVRSALCAPVFVRGQPAGCFYIDHRNVTGLFGEDEKRLAEFIATIAGAALENAQGFAQLQELAATLERKVQQRTEHIESQKKELESLNEELGRSNSDLQQFAYVASHDLQEPLRTVTSFCGLIKEQYGDKLDKEGIEFIEFAVDGATRMKTLIADLLTYSRVGTRSKPFAPTDCQRILDRVLLGLKIAIEESGAKITCDSLPTVMGDETQLAQLFQNLIGNAIKFCKNETPQIHIGVQQQDQDWCFSVRDNGIGIAEEHQARVFQIFQRLHARDEYSGTGIGLAVCKKTVECHGGRIWVESEPGSGSTFQFTIPIQESVPT